MNITFKAAEKTDIDILLVFIQEFYEVDHHSFDAVIARDALTQLLENNFLGQVWLIHYLDEAVGYVVLTFGYSLEYRGRDAFVDELYIRPSHHRQGIGTQTLKFIEEICSALDIHALHLEVDWENTSAQSFYRQVGFKAHNNYLMTKWLSTL